jgi:tetratricopeptide (TPR) repeat protein
VARTRLRHRDWFLSLAERVATDLEERPDQAGRLQRLETEHDNFRAALAWSLERGDAEVVLRLAGALLPFWLVRGYATEARGWFECGLALEGSVPALVRAKALHAAADLAQDQGDYGTARTFLSESLSLWRELGDPAGIAATLSTFANLEYQSGEYQTARTLFEESLTLARQMGQQSVTAYALSFLGNLDQIAEDFAGARARYDEAEALCVETGNTALLILARNNLGFLAYEEGRYADARAQYEANLSMADALGYTYGHVLTLGNLAHLNRKEGDYQAARSLFCDALRAARELGSRRGIAFYLGCLGMVAAAEGQMERAVRLLAADAALRRSFNGPPVPYYLQDQDQAMATVRAAFDEEAFDALWAEGAALLRDQAIAYALTSDAGPIK